MFIFLNFLLLYAASPEVLKDPLSAQAETSEAAAEEGICSGCEFYPIPGTQWFISNTEAIWNIAEDAQARPYLIPTPDTAAAVTATSASEEELNMSSANFCLLKVSEWNKFRQKILSLVESLRIYAQQSRDLERLLQQLSSQKIIFTTGSQAQTLEGGDTAVVELCKHFFPDLLKGGVQRVQHVALNLKELDESFVYSIAAVRKLSCPPDGRVNEFYLLKPVKQPDYMILAHELLHVFYHSKEGVRSDFPPEEWISRYAHTTLWSQHEDQRRGEASYAHTMKKLWTSVGEIQVIMGLPSGARDITENTIKAQLDLPLRIFHKGPDTDSLSGCLFEPSEYIAAGMNHEMKPSIPTPENLSEADAYALSKFYKHIPISAKSSSKNITPNLGDSDLSGSGRQRRDSDDERPTTARSKVAEWKTEEDRTTEDV